MADDRAYPDPGRIATQADFGDELTALRLRAGLRIRDVARASGIPVSTTGDYFSGRHLPADVQQLVRILEACGETDLTRIERWQAALRQARRSPGRRTDTPYRGLARFETRDARWFFGREDVTEQLVSLAAQASALPLILVGPSGAGKSSVLRAGLLPRLRELAGTAPGIAGPVRVFEPTSSPVTDLDAILVELTADWPGSKVGSEGSEEGRPGSGADSEGSEGGRHGSGTGSGGSEAGRPALIVDQFEAVFTRCPDEAQRRDFIARLCDLAQNALVVLALRADFYDHALRYPCLASALQSRQVLLRPMTAEQVRRAVTEPARLARLNVEDGLVGLLLADLAPQGAAGAGGAGADGAYEPGALPLLSHAMLATWEHSSGGTLTVTDYLASGGIKNALTQTAERAYGGLSPDQQRLARRLFLRLVHVADDLPPSRATVGLDELRGWGEPASGPASRSDPGSTHPAPGNAAPAPGDAAPAPDDAAPALSDGAPAYDPAGSTSGPAPGDVAVPGDAAPAPSDAAPMPSSISPTPDPAGPEPSDAERVLATFVDERMITVDAGTAQITHDALLTAWPRLRSWIEDGMIGLRARRRITLGARAWEDAGRESAALWRGTQLAVARDWTADSDNRASLPAQALAFVDASIAEDGARQRAERRRTRGLQGLVAVLTALVVVVAGLTAYAFGQRQAAMTAQHETSAGEVALEANQIRALNPPLAAQLSVSAYGLVHTQLATASLLESSDTPSAARILDSAGIVEAVAIRPDHKLLAAAGADGTLRLWQVARPGHPSLASTVVRADLSHPLYTTEFSPEGSVLAAAGAGRVVHLWDVSDPARPRPLGAPLTGPANTIYSVAFSPDGKTLAAGSADGTVRLWDMTDPARAEPLGRPLTGPGVNSDVESIAFSPDGSTLAAGTATGTVLLWNVARPTRPVPLPGMPLTGPASFVSGVAFSPDGRMLAASSQDMKVWLWKIGGGRASAAGALTGATNWANTVAFSPDGRSLAAGTSDASVLVWNLATRALTETLPQTQPVTSVTWDGPALIGSGDADGTVSVWMVPTPVLPAGDKSTSVVYSPDGRTLAVGGHGDVQLWDAASREQVATLSLAGGTFVNALAYSPGGRVIAAAYSDGTVGLLDARTLMPRGPPFRVTASGTAETIAFSPDGGTLATGSDDGTVRLWSVSDPARPRQLSSVRDSSTYVYTVAYAPDGKTLAAASTDTFTRLWKVADPARPVLLGKPLGGFTSYAIGLAFTPDSRLLAIGSADKTVRLWNVAHPARPSMVGAPLTGPAGYVWALAFSPNGTTLAAGVTDGTVWLWNFADPDSPSLIATLTGPAGHVYSVAFAPAGGQLAASSSDGTVHLWDTNPTVARAVICANLGQPLTKKEWSAYVPDVRYHAPCS